MQRLDVLSRPGARPILTGMVAGPRPCPAPPPLRFALPLHVPRPFPPTSPNHNLITPPSAPPTCSAFRLVMARLST